MVQRDAEEIQVPERSPGELDEESRAEQQTSTDQGVECSGFITPVSTQTITQVLRGRKRETDRKTGDTRKGKHHEQIMSDSRLETARCRERLCSTGLGPCNTFNF